MLLPTMNITEITLQVKRDYEKIRDTTLIRLGDEYDRERRKLKIDKKRTYAKVYTFKTATKNNWILVLAKKPESEIYKSPYESLTVNLVTYFYDETGLKVLKWADPFLQIYSAHFIQRYNQRLELGLNTPVDIIKHYLIHNAQISPKCLMKNGIFYIVGYANQGLLLGTLQPEDWILWRTFVSRDLIRPEQQEMEKEVIRYRDVQKIREMINTKMDIKLASYPLKHLEIHTGKYTPGIRPL